MSAECLQSHSSPRGLVGSTHTSLRCQKARCNPKGQGGRVGTCGRGFFLAFHSFTVLAWSWIPAARWRFRVYLLPLGHD